MLQYGESARLQKEGPGGHFGLEIDFLLPLALVLHKSKLGETHLPKGYREEEQGTANEKFMQGAQRFKFD